MQQFNAGEPSNIESIQYVVPTAGNTVSADGSGALLLAPAGTLATLTVVLPASPTDGQKFVVATSQEITALTVTGSIVGTLTSLALGAYARFIYSATLTKWFRVG